MTKLTKMNVILLTLALIASSFGYSADAASAPNLGNQVVDVTGSHNVRIYVTVDPNGSSTDISFKYKTESGSFRNSVYGNVTSPMTTSNWGLVGLLAGTTYSYQIEARNSYGITTGISGTFTTPGGSTTTGGSNSSGSSGSGGSVNNGNTSNYNGSNNGAPIAPQAVTNGPVSVSTNSATVNGSINPGNADTKFWFEFGLTQSFGKKSSVEPAGSGNLWQLVSGNLSGLESGRTYYYRVVAQNNFGTALGDTMNFTTKGSGGNSSSGNGGQVLGAVSGSGSGTGSGTGTGSGKTSSTVQTAGTSTNPRPSFISLEYSLDDSGALVLVANNLKPKPGEEFTYTVISKNDSRTSFNETSLKILLPAEVEFVGSNVEPLRTSGAVIEFDLGTIAPLSRNATVITVRVKESVKPGTGMIFTSVMSYKDSTGTQLATTSYMTVKVGQGGGSISLSAFSLGSLASSASVIMLVAVGLLVLMAIVTYKFIKIRNGKNKKKEDDMFGKGAIPPTFQPISDGSFSRR